MFAHEDGGPEPDWVKTEREQFSDFRDLNKDGKMDQDEIRHWIMPQDYDHAQAEARHLVYESDQDKVNCLTCINTYKNLFLFYTIVFDVLKLIKIHLKPLVIWLEYIMFFLHSLHS